jgi:hypothetical protein
MPGPAIFSPTGSFETSKTEPRLEIIPGRPREARSQSGTVQGGLRGGGTYNPAMRVKNGYRRPILRKAGLGS